ncbi:MAG: class I SAM-dependent methyltransferase [Anaerolineaceae bacterium]|jgi:SAM-dependent methyltransferase
MLLRTLLVHPLTRDLDLNDPRLTELRREVIRSKPFLLKIYQDWYTWIAACSACGPAGTGSVLELGAGAGFLAEYIPGLVTSEVFFCRGISVVADGQQMPFATASLRAIVFTDVLHHLPQVRLFFQEAARCLQPGGRVIMIEPWVSAWSRFIYPRLHHERFDPNAPTWEFPSSGPLSGSNQALPWIIFSRDREQFDSEFPEWQVRQVLPKMPLRYLVSGGLTTRNLVPAWSYGFWKWLEGGFGSNGMFVGIVLERA